MNARQRCRERRQMHYRQQCKKDDEIRLLRLSILRGYETRSTEEIIDSIWRKTLDQQRDNIDTLADFLYTFKKGLDITNNSEEASFTNCCIPNTYLYAVKRRGRSPFLSRKKIMFKQLSRPGKNIYVGAVLRDRLDKIVLDIGHYIGRPVTISEFIHYVVERHGDEAKDNLKRILGTEEERTLTDKKRR